MAQAAAIKVPKFKKAAEAAEWIADTINKKNWYKGAIAIGPPPKNDPEGVGKEYEKVTKSVAQNAIAFCALGWCDKANQGFEKQVKQAVADVLAVEMGWFEPAFPSDVDEGDKVDPTDIIPEWNDNFDRTVGDVKKVFRKAAKALAQTQAKPQAKKPAKAAAKAAASTKSKKKAAKKK